MEKQPIKPLARVRQGLKLKDQKYGLHHHR